MVNLKTEQAVLDKLWTIPKKWSWVIMREIAEIKSGSTPNTSDKGNWNGDIIWVTPDDLSRQKTKYFIEGRRNISKRGFDSCSTQMLPKNTVIFSSRAPIGYVAIAGTELCTNQGCKNFILRPGINPEYIYYYLQLGKDFAEMLASGTTFKEISSKKAQMIPVPLPLNLKEQKNIVRAIEAQFTRFDAAIKSLKTIKSQLEFYRQSVLKAAFDGKWVSTGDIAESVLNEVCEAITDGTHLTPPLVSSGIPMLDVKDLDEFFNIWIINPRKFISLETDKELAKRCKPKEGDILISSRGTIGRIGVVKHGQNFNIMGNMILIRVNKSFLNVKYTAFALKFLKYKFEKLARGVAQKGLYLRNVRTFKLKYPKELAEQVQVVAEIESRFSVIDKVERVIDNAFLKAERLRKSILKAAFEGKLVD